MNINRTLAAAVVVALLVGFNWGGGRWERRPFIPVPIPTPAPRPDEQSRPFLRFFVRAAKNLLWLAAIAEPPPIPSDTRTVQHAIGADGYPVVDHSRGL